jgi:hypothetical protein
MQQQQWLYSDSQERLQETERGWGKSEDVELQEPAELVKVSRFEI